MALCELFLGVGLSLGGFCEETQPEPRGLPATNKAVFEYRKPTPKPVPVQVVQLPPVVVKQEVPVVETKEVEKPVEVERIKYVEVPVVLTPPKPRVPDPLELELQAGLANRTSAQSRLGGKGTLGQSGGSSFGTMRQMNASSAVLPAFAPPEGIDPQNDQYQAANRISTSAVDNSRIVAADRYITGIMETGVNSQLSDAGTAVIQVSRDVFGYHGRNILIPKGSRMICSYESAEKAGQSRVPFKCKRILLGESRAEIFQLAAKVGDPQGYAGLSGDVDNRWWERYGSAVITVGIGAAVESAVSLSSRLGPKNADTAREALSGISENIGLLSSHFLEETVDLKPVIRISQGTRVQIRPEYDWYLAKP
ncbi:TrbI/VirB10 family protein [Polycladidibacter hongkongensis]|uniref:TrbI/VirB10 family protein n=1 Tax=Polycladidibacter hongkongensis TaxID=1647556 RepID=UPI00082EDEF4|nr:TrbI/VirB10 family protein [Pseudovibrio hongkongensis]